MIAETKIAEELRALEVRLMDPLVRRSPREVDSLLADDFIEFGSSGRIYDKPTMIEALQQAPGFDGPRTITEFNARELSPSIMLVTYRIRETATLRSSIWRSNGKHWKMAFHQGTRSALE
ncbi:DUF4440 domain-containing protein [Pelagibius sp.]|uniref:nuclear transport factor 2 family protein n=1 Tax=Pelagibius sp. TaxID=1931238 RepID=UPI003BAEE7C1